VVGVVVEIAEEVNKALVEVHDGGLDGVVLVVLPVDAAFEHLLDGRAPGAVVDYVSAIRQ
jgi:hypothetical protein